jgi:quinoprotein glucose dehydrogenase
LIIDGILYGTSPKLKLFALDASTGEELWRFDPFGGDYEMYGMGVNRGVAFWTNGEEKRIFYSATDQLYAVDAVTGEKVNSFGDQGTVDLHTGLGDRAKDFFVVSNSPGVIHQDLLIMGSRVSESSGAAPGYIRAFNVKTGALEWTFHTIPRPGEFGYDTWPKDGYNRIGGANGWSGMSIDREREVVFVPTGSAAYDFYGGDRQGQNLFANCVIALDANTGERIWHYQTVHHDLWDRDIPCPPNLVKLNIDGREVDAIAQVTKSAHIFLLDRETGEPLFPVKEVPVPPSRLNGEAAWPTQPIPSKPPQFSRSRVLESDLTDRSPEAHAFAKQIWSQIEEGPGFSPPSEKGVFIFPGFDGGGEWGGGAVDEETGILYINASEMPWVIQMIKFEPVEDGSLASLGKNLYSRNCMICHGKTLEGASIHSIPSISDLKERLPVKTVRQTIIGGKGMMPAFGHLDSTQVDALVAYLYGSKDDPDRDLAVGKGVSANNKKDTNAYPYVMTGYNRFEDPDGYPAIKPPWGTLNAIDLNTGTILWKKTLGTFPELESQYGGPTGCQNYGGPVVTAGGLVFVAATQDERFRVFDKLDGTLLFETELPAAGYATPATYMLNGKQYVVIACGGGKLGTKSGDQYIAFSLP